MLHLHYWWNQYSVSHAVFLKYWLLSRNSWSLQLINDPSECLRFRLKRHNTTDTAGWAAQQTVNSASSSLKLHSAKFCIKKNKIQVVDVVLYFITRKFYLHLLRAEPTLCSKLTSCFIIHSFLWHLEPLTCKIAKCSLKAKPRQSITHQSLQIYSIIGQYWRCAHQDFDVPI